MRRRHRVAAEWVPEEPPKWAACREDERGGWYAVLVEALFAAAGRRFDELMGKTDDKLFARTANESLDELRGLLGIAAGLP